MLRLKWMSQMGDYTWTDKRIALGQSSSTIFPYKRCCFHCHGQCSRHFDDYHPILGNSIFWRLISPKYSQLSNGGQVTHISISGLCHYSSLLWFVACSAPSHHLHQCWHTGKWALRNKQFGCNLNKCRKIFIEQNALEKVGCKMAVILSWLLCVNVPHSSPGSLLSVQNHHIFTCITSTLNAIAWYNWPCSNETRL